MSRGPNDDLKNRFFKKIISTWGSGSLTLTTTVMKLHNIAIHRNRLNFQVLYQFRKAISWLPNLNHDNHWQEPFTKHNNTCYSQLCLFSVGFAVLTHPHRCWTDCFKQAWRLATVAPHVYGGEVFNYALHYWRQKCVKIFYFKDLRKVSYHTDYHEDFGHPV